jgi:hypothetical protein
MIKGLTLTLIFLAVDSPVKRREEATEKVSTFDDEGDLERIMKIHLLAYLNKRMFYHL